jgi:hypothetical protein
MAGPPPVCGRRPGAPRVANVETHHISMVFRLGSIWRLSVANETWGSTRRGAWGCSVLLGEGSAAGY